MDGFLQYITQAGLAPLSNATSLCAECLYIMSIAPYAHPLHSVSTFSRVYSYIIGLKYAT